MAKHKRSFISDTSGLAYIYAMFFLAIPLMFVVYFPLSYVWDHLYAFIVGQYTYTGDTALGIAAKQFIISYLLAFGLIFNTVWSFINSKASQYD